MLQELKTLRTFISKETKNPLANCFKVIPKEKVSYPSYQQSSYLKPTSTIWKCSTKTLTTNNIA